jgi:hypothetical protein
VWRKLQPAGTEVRAIGYRFYKIRDGRIIEHTALIDGQTIEDQLKDTSHSCKIADKRTVKGLQKEALAKEENILET